MRNDAEQVPIKLILERCISFWFENILKTKKTIIFPKIKYSVNTTLKNKVDLVYIRITLYFILSE